MVPCKPGLWRVDGFAPNIGAYQTGRAGGSSAKPYASFNLGLHVGDDPLSVAANRLRLAVMLGTPRLAFMQQVHSAKVKIISSPEVTEPCDGLVTAEENLALCVMTADCLPLLMASVDGAAVAALHCGWRGLLSNIPQVGAACLRQFSSAPLQAWMGPAIGPESFEVGPEVREQFLQALPESVCCFYPGKGDRFLCDLYALTRIRLHQCGVEQVSAALVDTYTHTDLFYSYRRERVTGRMAAVIIKKQV